MKILLFVFIGFTIIIVGFMIMFSLAKKKDSLKNKHHLLEFMVKNREACSLTLLQNKKDILTFNENKEMSLASTVKLIYLITFVEAVREKNVNLLEKIKVKDLDLLYLENTDGGAHPRWKKEKGIGEEVTLFEIAQGMMQFSSNACTDFLFQKLGPDRLNQTLATYHTDPHSSIYAINSAMIIPVYLKIEKKLKKREIAQTIKEMPQKEFESLANTLLKKLLSKDATIYLKELSTVNDMGIQREMVNKLPSSTTNQYAKLMMHLGESNDLTDDDKELIDNILGRSNYTAVGNRRWFKGGSTAFTLTSALYNENKNESVSLSLFIYDESRFELLWIRNVFHDFLKALIEDDNFRKKAIMRLEK